MAQESVMAVVNTRTGEESEDQSRSVGQASSSRLYHTAGQSSGILAGNSSALTSSSSPYYSTRIYNMIRYRSSFTSEVEFDIAYSKDHHWSDLVDSDTDNASTRLSNREYFQQLKNHPQWGAFFTSVKVVVGQKINEGAQAEIYDAKVEFEDGRKSPDYGYHVVKVMKGDNPLEDFQRQWPVGMLCNASRDRVKGPLMWILGGTMIHNRFAFVMLKQWGDLRKLIDERMQLNANLCPPDFGVDFLIEVLLCIARDMDALHTKYDILHRDLKASNILLWSLGEGLPCDNPHVKANVVDYECSMGVVGSRFWRAPEILQQLKDRVPSSKIAFTKAADVYSYGMICYELLTGRIPFEEHSGRNFNVVLKGHTLKEGLQKLGVPWLQLEFAKRKLSPLSWRVFAGIHERMENFSESHKGTGSLLVPAFASEVGWDCIDSFYKREIFIQIMWDCWNHEPSARPSFSEIVKKLENEKRRKQRRKYTQHIVSNQSSKPIRATGRYILNTTSTSMDIVDAEFFNCLIPPQTYRKSSSFDSNDQSRLELLRFSIRKHEISASNVGFTCTY